MMVKMNVHHLEDLVSADRGRARHRLDMEAKGAPKYLINVFASWYNRHSDELFQLRAKHPPEWQEAPRQWQPLHIHPRTSMTVIGGREAKQEKTKTIVQGLCHLQVDEEYLDNRPSGKPLCVPMCHKGNRSPSPPRRVRMECGSPSPKRPKRRISTKSSVNTMPAPGGMASQTPTSTSMDVPRFARRCKTP